jgi:capsular polysaccharide transport system ATP-binding protein
VVILNSVDKCFRGVYGERRVFAGLSARLPTDRRLALLGAQGSGKSTLISLLAGLEEPSAGSIIRYARLSFPVGYSRGLKYYMSARQNASHAARIYEADIDEVVGFVEQVVDIGEEFDEPLRTLTAHQRAAFAFALAYAIPFDAYLLDGHIGSGDAEFRRKCFAMFEGRIAGGAGVILAVRDLRTARRYCDCGAVIRDGRLLVFDELEEAIAALQDPVAEPAARLAPAG